MSEKGVQFRVLVDKGVPRTVESLGDFFGVTLNTVLTMTQLINVKVICSIKFNWTIVALNTF